MPRRKPAPYVKVSIVALSDPDYLTLMRTQKGRAALGCWHFALMIFREDAWRGGVPGRLRHGVAVLAARCQSGGGASAARWRHAVDTIAAACRSNGHEPWIVEDGDDLVIRNWNKYNELRGGDPTARQPTDDASEVHFGTPKRNTGGAQRGPPGSGTGSMKQVAHDGPIEPALPSGVAVHGLARAVFLDCAARAGHEPRLSAEEARTLASTFRQQELVENPEERREQVLAALEWASTSDDQWFRQASLDPGMLGRQFGKIWAAWLSLHPEARSPRSGERDASAAQHSTPGAPPLKPRRRRQS